MIFKPGDQNDSFDVKVYKIKVSVKTWKMYVNIFDLLPFSKSLFSRGGGKRSKPIWKKIKFLSFFGVLKFQP